MQKEELLRLLQDPDVCREIFLIMKNGGKPNVQAAAPKAAPSADAEKLRAMEEIRTPLYAACADYAVDSQPDKAMTAKAIVEGFYEAVGAERAEPEHAGDSGKASVRNGNL